MLLRIWNKRKSHSLLIGKMVQLLEGRLVDSYNTKHTSTTWSSSWVPWYLSKEVESYAHTKPCMWMCVAALLIITRTWKQPRCLSLGDWINCAISRKNGILFSTERKWAIKPWEDVEEVFILLSEKMPVGKSYIWYDSNYTKLWKRQWHRSFLG